MTWKYDLLSFLKGKGTYIISYMQHFEICDRVTVIAI